MTAYAAVETALANLHGADPQTQRGAFRGRIKHLQRLGLPLGDKPGKGKRIDYSEDQVFQLAIALELSEFGLDPSAIVQFIISFWATIELELRSYTKSHGERILIYRVSLMSDLWGGDNRESFTVSSVTWAPKNVPIADALLLDNRRAIVLDVHTTINKLRALISVKKKE